MEFDVVVVGSGAAGMTAALVAAIAGLRVVLVEKSEYFGGTTAYSGGGLWVPGNHHQKDVGLPDSFEEADRYLRNVLGNYYDSEKVHAFLSAAPEMIKFVEGNSEVRTISAGGIDYEPWQKGAALGRTLLIPAYDIKRLGTYRRKLRPPLPQLTLFSGMQIGVEDVAHFANVTRSAKSFLYSGGKFAHHVLDRLIHGQSTRIVNGNALAAELLKGVVDHGVTLWNFCPLTRIVKTGDAVSGVTVNRDGRDVTIAARKGVILATGGYGANAKMRAQNVPMADQGWSLQPESNQGDGINLGIAAGGTFVHENSANGIWIPVSSRVRADGTREVYPHMYERHKPGFIVVDPSGRRFVNEGISYQAFGNVMHEKNIERAFVIGDHPAIRRYGLGLAKPAPLSFKPYLASDYTRKSDTVGGLAALLGIDAKALTETVDAFNEHADHGRDPAFQRGEDVYSAVMGDPSHKPNAAVGPLRHPPFYGVEVRRGELSTMNGLQTNAKAQVLGKAGEPISGLYAVGVDANSIFRGAYPGAGASLGPAMTFAYIAARHVAGLT